ncbi:hypothetical protein EVG20_g10892 [Dentipellis fragilis]|uniref:Uncharacterized protein n=1 Tax=Dentipellis fragilis TaxID=205917 RepID=A0A4Y9XNJ6_9AGAM|nr:hypothetical protein EVG20_g10892 [Dentipellis fragilis]
MSSTTPFTLAHQDLEEITCSAPVPNGVLKHGPADVIKWEASIYKVLQRDGYPRILIAYDEVGDGRATLCMRYLVVAGWLLALKSNLSTYRTTVTSNEYHTSAATFTAGLIDMLAKIHRSGSIPVFFDFGRARYNGRRSSAPQSPPWNDYTPDRILTHESNDECDYHRGFHLVTAVVSLSSRYIFAAYTARDDLESLAYTALIVIKPDFFTWG